MPHGHDLTRFRLPPGFRGRNALWVQTWWLVQALVFKPLPQVAYPLRRALLRLFGATVGRGVLIRPGVTVTYPWKVRLGDFSWVGDDVTLYSLGHIDIGSHVVISQETYVCAADHDPTSIDFSIRERPVRIDDGAWVAARCFVGPGVHVGAGAVVGAASVVTRDVAAGMMAWGHPCRAVRERRIGEPGGREPAVPAHGRR